MPIADMRHVVAAIDDRPRHSGGGCTLSKQTPRPAAVASPKGQQQTTISIAGLGLAAAGIMPIPVVGAFPCNPNRD